MTGGHPVALRVTYTQLKPLWQNGATAGSHPRCCCGAPPLRYSFHIFILLAFITTMKILHTSDWHLGRTLYGRRRQAEFVAFLDWLLQRLASEQVDVLVVAGDIFDTSTPGTAAQELYYRFLARVGKTGCRHVVIVGGNHDSPSFLDAPAGLLRALDVHVVGQACADPADQVLLLRDAAGAPQLIVCAVPYLRDRDIRQAEADESIRDKEQKLQDGIRAHYAAIGAAASTLNAGLERAVPVIGTGHLFAAGGQTVEGDGVRELYVGSLAHVHAGVFPGCFDYVALGHLHVPQQVGGQAHIRYSGSPLPMGFGEARQQKSLCLVQFARDGQQAFVPQVELLDIPVFQRLERIAGNLPDISLRLQALRHENEPVWLEVLYTGVEIASDLREQLEEQVAGSALEILRIRNQRVVQQVLEQGRAEETLDDLSELDVFGRCLDAHQVPEQQRDELLHSYQQVLESLHDADGMAGQGEQPA